jgi:hypothetical protein
MPPTSGRETGVTTAFEPVIDDRRLHFSADGARFVDRETGSDRTFSGGQRFAGRQAAARSRPRRHVRIRLGRLRTGHPTVPVTPSSRLTPLATSLDRGDDLIQCVFLDVVRRATQDLGPVVGERLLPAKPVGSLNPGSFSPHTISAGLPATRSRPRSTSARSACAPRTARGMTCNGTRDSGVGRRCLRIARSAGVSFFRLMPPLMNTFTKISARLTLLIAFLVSTALLIHGFWKESDPQAKQMEQVQFIKDLALALLALMLLGLFAHLGDDLGLVLVGPLLDC